MKRFHVSTVSASVSASSYRGRWPPVNRRSSAGFHYRQTPSSTERNSNRVRNCTEENDAFHATRIIESTNDGTAIARDSHDLCHGETVTDGGGSGGGNGGGD